jgi:toxin-antitoxin system PIN domain toxin
VRAELGDLLDVNVWLALAAPSHVHHAAARAYWMQPELPRVWFNRVTMLSLLRLLCEPKVMGPARLSVAGALDVFSYFERLPEVGFMDEPHTCGPAFVKAARAMEQTPSRLLTDLYLACFAQAAKLRLVTFDRDFERLSETCGTTVVRLSTSAH